jgi:ABC-type multidrug transport system fused ATPase/permease subunit
MVRRDMQFSLSEALHGSVSVALQETWIMSGSVRENIIFGQEFDAALYTRVLQAVCLEDDLQQLADGDATIVGERGETLSGGQRKRVNLARSIYA